MKRRIEKSNSWENLQGFRYAHRGLFRQPKTASRKLLPGEQEILWKEDVVRWKEEGKRIVPENSVEAFRLAVKHGFGSELDVHLSEDGCLVVFHDDRLLRMTGEEGHVEEKTWQELSQLRLLDTEYRIPRLEEVLDIYTSERAESGRRDRRYSGPEGKPLYLPLIIELKAVRNVSALCRRVMETLDRYPELNYCVESFDPRVVLWLRRRRPDVIRGQLTENFMKSREAVRQWGHVMTFGMWSVAPDVVTRPDFIASKFKDRKNPFIRLSHRFGVRQVNWIIRNRRDLAVVDQEGGLSIFEQFVPDREPSHRQKNTATGRVTPTGAASRPWQE